MTEEWRAVPDFEGIYEVSDLGRVRSLDRIVDRPGPAGPWRLRGRIRKTNIYKDIHRVSLSNDAEIITKRVAVLVAKAFLGPCPEGLCVRHGNLGISIDNLDNIYYGELPVNAGNLVRGRG